MTDATSDVSSKDFDPRLMDRVLNNEDDMSVVSDLSDACLDEREFDDTLAADIHLAIVESGTPYGDLGHLSLSPTKAFLPEEGSLGADSIDNSDLFPHAPEVFVDIEDSKFNGHTQKIPKNQSQSTTHPVTPQGVPRRKYGSTGIKGSKRSTGGDTYGGLGGRAQEKGGAVLRDDSISYLDAGLFCEGSSEAKNPVGQVAPSHSSLLSLEPPMTPKALPRQTTKQMPASFLSAGNLNRPKLTMTPDAATPRRSVTKQMIAGFHSVGNLNRPKLSFGMKGRKKGTQHPIHEDLSDMGTYGNGGGMSYGDRGGMSEGQAASFLPDHSTTSLQDEGFFLVDSPERSFGAPPRRRVGSKQSLATSNHSAGGRSLSTSNHRGKVGNSNSNHSIGKRNGTEIPDGIEGGLPTEAAAYGDLGGMSAASLLQDHSISDLGDPAFSERSSGAPLRRRVGSKQSLTASLHSAGGRSLSTSNHSAVGKRGKVGNSNSNQAGIYGDLGGMTEERATSYLPDHSISDLCDPTLLLGGSADANEMDRSGHSLRDTVFETGSWASILSGEGPLNGGSANANEMDQSGHSLRHRIGTGSWASVLSGDGLSVGSSVNDAVPEMIPMTPQVAPRQSSMVSPLLFPEVMKDPLSIQHLQPPMTPQPARRGKKKSKGLKGPKLANTADVADAHPDSSFPAIIHSAGNISISNLSLDANEMDQSGHSLRDRIGTGSWASILSGDGSADAVPEMAPTTSQVAHRRVVSVSSLFGGNASYGDLGEMMEARAASFLPDDCSTDSPGLFPEEMKDPLSIQNLQPPMTPQSARRKKKKSKGRKGPKVANTADVADAHLDSSFPAVIHSAGNMSKSTVQRSSAGDIITDMGAYGDLRGLSEAHAVSFLPDVNKGIDTAGLFLDGTVEGNGNAVGASDAMDAAFGTGEDQPSFRREFMQKPDAHSDLNPPGSPVHVKAVSSFSETQSSGDVSRAHFSLGVFNPHTDGTDAIAMPKKPPGRPINSKSQSRQEEGKSRQ
jgi:hypothetical protein